MNEIGSDSGMRIQMDCHGMEYLNGNTDGKNE